MKLSIAEEFHSIQGEGQFTGVPSYFVRVSGCNLRCWWCDTPYTSWAPSGVMTELSDIIARARECSARHVVITGGEPMLFPKEMAYLTYNFRLMGKIITIETNGTRFDEQVAPHLFSVSPKLRSSSPSGRVANAKQATEIHERNIAAASLLRFDRGCDMAQYKFVVTDENDVTEVRKMVARHKLPNHLIYLMPEGRTATEVLAKQAWIAEACIREGYNMSTRLHTLIWGPKRGV